MDRFFGERQHSLASLFRDEQRRVLKRLLRAGLAETMDLYTRMFAGAQPLMRFLKHLSVPLPMPLRAATEVLFNTDLRWAFADDEPDFNQVRQLVAESAEWGVHLDVKALSYKFTRQLARTADRWRNQPLQVDAMQGLLDGLDLARDLPFEPDLYHPQNVFFEMAGTTFGARAEQAAAGDEEAQQWAERFLQLGGRLGIDVEALKKKLTELGRRPRVAELVARLSEGRRVPLATYRLQMRREFTFRHAAAQADYLARLGVSDVYLSPVLQARPGSPHGYDICDHTHINPELGGEGGLAALAAALEAHGMGAVLDVVPNHMGINHPSNRWWQDVLENGASSHYSEYFDIDWAPLNPELAGKVLLPTLGEQYGQALEGGKFRLSYDKGTFTLSYYDHLFPVAPRSYHDVLSSRLEALSGRLGENHEQVLEYRSILTALHHVPPRTFAAERRAERYREVAIIKRRLATLVENSPEVRHAVESAVELYNGHVGSPASFDRLDALIGAQPYRPAFWRVAGDEINYRRFFDVNDLAAIRTERREVFEATHAVPLRLLVEGQVHALRIDHPDGLYSPADYFFSLQEGYAREKLRPLVEGQLTEKRFARQLRAALTALPGQRRPWPLYVIAEKILGDGEPLPRDWAVDGTTGYDFLVALNGLFVAGENEDAMDLLYAEMVDFPPAFGPLVAASKALVMQVSMVSEIASLSHQLDRLAERNRRYRDFTLNNLRYAVRELIACLAVYRTYTTDKGTVSDRDRGFIEAATEEAKRRNPRTAEAVFDFLRDTLLLRHLDQFPEGDRPRLLEWVLRFQQLTGPVMAKGIEDTAFYVYNRLVSLNEVGGHPDHFGTTVESFHRQCAERAASWPLAMLATATHDTKRGEDVRVRISALSEMPAEWGRVVRGWRELHAPLVQTVDGRPAPAANDQYLFYQTLVGSCPDELLGREEPSRAKAEAPARRARGGVATKERKETASAPPAFDAEALAGYRRRLVEYMHKATKEAKQYTSWINPNEEYDEAVRAFVERALAEGPDGPFLRSFLPFARKVAFFGRLNSLAQVLFKTTCPGVPDFYQGSELWDLSLVDPDNRRAVDYDRRRRLLDEVRDLRGPEALAGLLETMADGRVKLFLTTRLLRLRRRKRALFEKGDYQPVMTAGAEAEAVCAFVRQHEAERLLVAGCVRPVRLAGGEAALPLGERWGDTFLAWPGERVAELRNVITEEVVALTEREGRAGVRAAEVFATFPVAVLEAV
jgi:(1->4)-alpha-D-glucan 1-alpha-D-glucosylmutase